MNLKKEWLEAWKPGVSRRVLLLVAGITWIGTAILLNAISYAWLRNEKPQAALLAALAGVVCALFIHHFGFLRIVDKNLGRIGTMEGKRCLFAFMAWKSYLLVMVMIAMGVLLRHSPAPRLYLAVLYTAIGTALFLSSIRYLRHCLGINKPKEGEAKNV